MRVATVKDLLLTADDHGRFHVACADLPDHRIGTNYVMKLDPRSLQSGYRLTTENPRVVRLDVSDTAFEEGPPDLRADWQERLQNVLVLLEQKPSVLRLVYRRDQTGTALRNGVRMH